ncbi:S8 family serine peptidase [Nonomuraea terrae]|uniref:S8 family serine peptidase n=1 Tax=Nonomuraea terrae TaxID=2530383 RepID=UPI0037AA4250
MTVAEASPLSEKQWWFDTWNIEETVWPRTKGAGVTVAVIDTGVNATLPDMRAAVVPGKSFQGSSSRDGRRDTQEGFGHGTGMASLIASRGNTTGFTGVAPKAKILPLVAPNVGTSTTAPAIRYAADHGAKVINISQGSPAFGGKACPDEVFEAVAYAVKKDAIVVAASGNEGDTTNEVTYPASCPGVVAIGAMDNQGRPWEKTQRQDYVALGAPGVNIPALSQDGRVWPNGAGTSHASALAAGAFALLRAEYPKMSARRIVQLATDTAKDLGPKGKDNRFGHGVISLRTALSRRFRRVRPTPCTSGWTRRWPNRTRRASPPRPLLPPRRDRATRARSSASRRS